MVWVAWGLGHGTGSAVVDASLLHTIGHIMILCSTLRRMQSMTPNKVVFVMAIPAHTVTIGEHSADIPAHTEAFATLEQAKKRVADLYSTTAWVIREVPAHRMDMWTGKEA